MGFRAAASGIPLRRKWDCAPTYRPQVANKRVSVFAKITGIGAKEDKKDLQASARRPPDVAGLSIAQGAPRGRRAGMLDGMLPCCAVPCGIGSARKKYQRDPTFRERQEVGMGLYK